MQLTVPQRDLAEAITWIAKTLPTNPIYPVMMTVRFEASEGRLRLSGWDGDTAHHAELEADVTERGVVLLPGKLIAGVVGGLRKSDLTLECSRGAGTLTAPGVRIDIRPSDPSEWPGLPSAPSAAGTVDGPAFMKAFSRIKAASVKPSDDAVNDLSGVGSVRLTASDGQLALATTDRFRIGQESVAWTPSTELGDAFAVVPTQAIERARPFSISQLELALPVNGMGTAGFSCSGRQVITKLSVPTTFPKVERAMPKIFVATALLEAAELIDAIRTVSMVNTSPHRPVWLRFSAGSVAVSATDMDTAEVRIDAQLDSELATFDVPFRGNFLTDGLASIRGGARIDFSGTRHPAVIRGVDDDSYSYIVLPIGDPDKASAA